MHFKPLTLFYIFISYAICLMALGSFGYYKTASTASLYSSFTFGILLLINAFIFLKAQKLGIYIARFLTSALSIVFLYRFILTQKAVPAIMGTLSFWILLCVWRYRLRIDSKVPN